MNIDKLPHLLGLYLDEGLNSTSKQELEEILIKSPSARKTFWQHANIHAMLRQLHRPTSTGDTHRFTA
ncbi:hypothetical protein FHS27_005593 [Rhodopirellula rubra]|uniref:Uncharacterized protein n=1 Tax=Aporhodopirellula rubra TaxID=980271 RepID=A0A7W5H8R7_9BACT|nr:hypothetical protein [Aporhodopirellula rubra]